MEASMEYVSNEENNVNIQPRMINVFFANFLHFVNEAINNDENNAGIEYLVGPLFCHLFLDALQFRRPQNAHALQCIHHSTVANMKTMGSVDSILQNLKCTPKFSTASQAIFRSKKYKVYLPIGCVEVLAKYLADEKCPAEIQYAFQKWFDIQEFEEDYEAETILLAIKNDYTKHQILKQTNINKSKHLPIFSFHLSKSDDLIFCAAMRHKSKIIAFAESNNVTIRYVNCFDTDGFSISVPYIASRSFEHTDVITHVAISPEGDLVAAASRDSNTILFDAKTMERMHTFEGASHSVNCLAFSSSSHFLATGCQDALVRVWSTINLALSKLLFGHTKAITAVQFHPNNSYIVSGSQDKSLRLWDVDSSNTIRLFPEFERIVGSIAFHPLGSFVATTSIDDGKIQVWNLQETTRFKGLEKRVEIIPNDDMSLKLAWNADGSVLCAGSVNGVVEMWDVLALLQEGYSRDVKVCNTNTAAVKISGTILDINSFNHGFAFLAHEFSIV